MSAGKLALSAALLAALLGCATAHEQSIENINAGRYQQAIASLTAQVRAGDTRAWNTLGVAYARLGKRDDAVYCYRMGARNGDNTAAQNLAILGEPIPDADLGNISGADAAQRAQADALLEEALFNAAGSVGGAAGYYYGSKPRK